MMGLLSDTMAVFLVFRFDCLLPADWEKPWRFYERFHLPRQLVLLPLWTGSIYRGYQCRKDEATVDQKQGKRTKQWPIEAV